MVSPSLVASPSSIFLGAEDFTTGFNLTCIVSGEGKFSWQWSDPNGGSPSTEVISDATRLSTAYFTATSISSNDAGMVAFTCEATYDPEVTGIDDIEQSGLQEITVELASEFYGMCMVICSMSNKHGDVSLNCNCGVCILCILDVQLIACMDFKI